MIDYKSTTPQERGILRAVVEGVKVRRVGAVWHVSSTSHPGHWHTVDGDECTCEASEAGRYCKHRAAVEMAQQTVPCRKCGGRRSAYLLNEAGLCAACVPVQRTCRHCRHVGYDVEFDRVSSSSYCANRQECWARFDAHNGLEA